MARIRRPRSLTGGVLGLALVLAACGGGGTSAEADGEQAGTQEAPAQTVTLQAQSYLSEGAALGRVAAWFYEQVEERTGGEVVVESFWDGSLVEALGIRDAVADGRLGLGQATHSYHADQFPLTSVTGVPFVTDNVPAQTAAMTQLYHENEELRAEWESQGLRLISFFAVPPSVLGAAAEPITTVDQLQGMQVRGVDRFITALEAVDANPVSLTAFELYESLERGVIAAYTGAPLDVVGSLGLHEVAPHIVDMGQGNYSGAYLAMNLDDWESLSAEAQQTIDEIAAELPSLVGEYYAEGEDAACETILSEGGSVGVMDQAEVDRWADLVDGAIYDQWAAGAGDGADEFFATYEAAVEAASAEFGDYANGIVRCAESQ